MIGRQRVADLMVERALWGLSAAAGRELALGCAQLGVVDDGSLDVTANVITGVMLEAACEQPSRRLLVRLRQDAIAYFAAR